MKLKLLLLALLLPLVTVAQNRQRDLDSDCIRRGIDTIESMRSPELSNEHDLIWPNTGSTDVAYIGILGNNAWATLYFDCVLQIDTLQTVGEALDFMYDKKPAQNHTTRTITGTERSNMDSIINHHRDHLRVRGVPIGRGGVFGKPNDYYGYTGTKPKMYSQQMPVAEYSWFTKMGISFINGDSTDLSLHNLLYTNDYYVDGVEVDSIIMNLKWGIRGTGVPVTITHLTNRDQDITDTSGTEYLIVDLWADDVFSLTFDENMNMIPDYQIVKKHNK